MRQYRYQGKLESKRVICKETYEVTISVSDPAFKFQSGQYVWVIIPRLSTPDSAGNRRAFSIVSSEKQPQQISIIFRTGQSGYKKSLLSLEKGQEIMIEGPFGMNFVFDNIKGKSLYIVAGGTGIAPFLSWLRSNKITKDYQITLTYIQSSQEETLLTEEIKSIINSTKIKLQEINGKFSQHDFEKNALAQFDSFFVSGPEGMVNLVSATLMNLGINPDLIYYEQFYPQAIGSVTVDDIEKFVQDKRNFGLRAIEQSTQHIVITDPNGFVLYANQAAQEITGYLFEEMKGNTPRLWGGLMDSSVYQKLWETVKSGEPFKGEITNRRKSGELYTAIARISSIKDDKGNIQAFVANEEDVTQLTDLNKQLKEEREKLMGEQAKDKAIFASLGEGLVITDAQGKIVFVNQTFEKLINYKFKDVLGKEMVTVLPKYDEHDQLIPKSKRSIQRVLAGEITRGSVSSLAHTHYYLTKDKKRLYITGVVTPIDIDGKVVGAVQIFRDINKEKEFDKAKDEFLSIASHELRTPLAAIDGIVAMIREGEYGEITDEVRQGLDDVNTSSERLIKLVNDLLSLSRIQAGRLKYNLSKFGAADVIKEVAKLFSVVSKDKGIAIRAEKLDDADIQADSDKLKQILNNLLNNALKFTDQGTIEISSKKESDRLVILIMDTGIGISEEDQEKLFGKFEQVGDQKNRQPGTGLGLHLSREMAKKMGGDLWLESSQLGKGSVFAVSLPLAGSVKAKSVEEEIRKEAEKHPDQKSDMMEKR